MKKIKLKNIYMFFYLFRRFPNYIIGSMLFSITMALPSYLGSVLFLKYIISAMIEHIPVYEMLFAITVLAILLIGFDIYSSFYRNIWQPKMLTKINKWFYYDFKYAAESHELYVYDDPSFFDDMSYVSAHIVNDAVASVSYISEIIAGVVNIVLISSIFSQTSVVILLIVTLSIVISFLFDLPIIRLNNNKKYAMTGIGRKKSYFFNCFFSRTSFMERKMTTVGDILIDGYGQSIKEQQKINKKYGGKIFLLSSLKDILSSNILLSLILFSYLLYETLVTHKLQESDFVAAYNATNVIAGSIMDIVIIIGHMKSTEYTIDKYFSLMSSLPSPKQSEIKQIETINTIEFRNLSFSYPGTDKMVLTNINMFLKAGDKIAIVGKNGSGKTTLVHLLMGLYFPTSGEILINGRKIQEEEYITYRRQFAAFFQGMSTLEASIAENVALDTDINSERVRLALLKTKSEKLLNKSQETIIGVQFDPNGLILSGGEFQKLMLSYCFYSDKELVVMDEPSSALDPISERDFNNQVKTLLEDKLTVFVTHRLSTIHMANCIYVIDNGKICAYGTHERLMKEEGVYRQMWIMQSEKYSNDSTSNL